MILVDPHNPTAQRFASELGNRFDVSTLPEGLHLVLGGDGFLLHSIHAHGLDPIYLGLNAGRIGFLLNDVADWDRVADQLTRQAWTVHDFSVLTAELQTSAGETIEVQAINDIALERSTGQTAHLELTIDDTLVVDRLVADGVIFSTALGSTAYTVSAGGPACHPSLGLLAVTPIAPHHPRLAPFLLPDRARANVRVIDAFRRPVRAVADGRTLDDIVSCSLVARDAKVHIAWLEGPDFTERMITKILHPWGARAQPGKAQSIGDSPRSDR